MKIGLIDYQLTNSHMKTFQKLLTGKVGGGEVTLTAAGELAPTEQGRQWAASVGIPYSECLEEIVEMSDAVLVLAPNNPEKHLEVAAPALTCGKPLYIDKLLAHEPAYAEEIIALTKRSNTPLMSASGLRFAPELDELDKRLKETPDEFFARGYGKFPTYGVHTITLALRYFGPEVKRVIDTGSPEARVITLDGGSRMATIEVRDSKNGIQANPWQVGVRAGGRYETATITKTEPFYENLMRNALQFFRTGKSPISTDELLAAVKVQSAAEQSLAQGGKWVEV